MFLNNKNYQGLAVAWISIAANLLRGSDNFKIMKNRLISIKNKSK